MNRQLFAVAPGKLEWREVPVPEPGPDEVVVRSQYGAVKQGTEFSMVKGTASLRGVWNEELRLHERVSRCRAAGDRGTHSGAEAGADAGSEVGAPEFVPFPVGNMIAGEVGMAGADVEAFAPGDPVFGYAPCSEYVCIHRGRLRRLSGMGWKSALCLDPARFSLGAVRDGTIRLGDTVAVFGLGAIGLISVRMAVLSGARLVFGIDPIETRRRIAVQMGAAEGLSPAECDIGRELKLRTEGTGVDVSVELSGSVGALQGCLRGTAFGGRVVCGAFPAPFPAGLDFGAEAHMNCLNIAFSRAGSDPNRDHPRWSSDRIENECYRMIETGQLDGNAIIDRVVPYKDFKQEYELVMADPARAVKLGVDFTKGGPQGEL